MNSEWARLIVAEGSSIDYFALIIHKAVKKGFSWMKTGSTSAVLQPTGYFAHWFSRFSFFFFFFFKRLTSLLTHLLVAPRAILFFLFFFFTFEWKVGSKEKLRRCRRRISTPVYGGCRHNREQRIATKRSRWNFPVVSNTFRGNERGTKEKREKYSSQTWFHSWLLDYSFLTSNFIDGRKERGQLRYPPPRTINIHSLNPT